MLLYYVIIGVVLFLVGFYAGRLWETRLEGKTIPLKTVCTVIFILVVIILGMISMKVSKHTDTAPEPSTPPPAQSQ